MSTGDEKSKLMTKIFQENQDMFFAKQNVVGVGIGHKIKNGQDMDEECITVFVSQKLDKALLKDSDLIPENLSGLKTDVVETGVILAGEALASQNEEVVAESLARRIRPAMGGYSVGHYRITAGTIATMVYDNIGDYGIPPKFYILSNNHVLANSNDASIGDPILQPGPIDGGTIPSDIIAYLSRYIPIKFISGSTIPINYVDAAIAEGQFHDLNREIYWIGYITGINNNPQIGNIVRKTGRTTNFTTGKILATNAIVDVNYGSGRVARFADQIITTNMSAGGDSGSLLCDISRKAVGLLFAGSSSITIFNRIANVQSLLGIKLTP